MSASEFSERGLWKTAEFSTARARYRAIAELSSRKKSHGAKAAAGNGLSRGKWGKRGGCSRSVAQVALKSPQLSYFRGKYSARYVENIAAPALGTPRYLCAISDYDALCLHVHIKTARLKSRATLRKSSVKMRGMSVSNVAWKFLVVFLWASVFST